MLALDLLDDYDCGNCTTHQRLSRGCEQNAPLSIELDGEELFRCPKRPLLDHPALYSDIFWLYQTYKEGHLPEPTSLGLLGQPNKYVLMMRVIDSALADLRNERQRRENRKAAAKAKAQMMG